MLTKYLGINDVYHTSDEQSGEELEGDEYLKTTDHMPEEVKKVL
jgi:hypothetical protein